MGPDDAISIEIHDVEDAILLVRIVGPTFSIDLIGGVFLLDRCLHVKKAHVQGAFPGALGRAGLNAIGRKLLLEADADAIVIEGSTRTTGRAKGRRPRPFRFPSEA